MISLVDQEVFFQPQIFDLTFKLLLSDIAQKKVHGLTGPMATMKVHLPPLAIAWLDKMGTEKSRDRSYHFSAN